MKKLPPCPHDYDNPIRKGRADYACRLCGKDITLELVMMYEAGWKPKKKKVSKK